MKNCCYACRVSIKRNDLDSREIVLCEDCTDITNILISKHNAKKKFNLDETDLLGVPCNAIKKNKYTYKTYYYDDILSKAYKKYGGVTQYIKKNNLLIEPDKYNIEMICDMKKCRSDLMLDTLDKMNCSYLDAVDMIHDYIEYGDESGHNYDEICELLKKN